MGSSPFLVRLARLVAEPAPPSSDHDPIGMGTGAEGGAAPPRAPPLIPAAVLMALAEGPAGPEVQPPDLLVRLFHEEGPRAFPAQPVRFGCTCSEERVRASLSIYSARDIATMTTPEGTVTADCQFCGAH